MPEIVFFAVKVGFLALLWLFVLFAVLALRTDLFGPRPARPTAARPPTPRARSERATRGRRAASVLVVTEGALAGTRVQLGSVPITIGRAEDSTLVLADDFVSTRHAHFVPRGDQWLVEDLGSTNGTYLDRDKVSGPTLVPLGVPVRIGKTVVELRS